ncbi:NAD(P)-binding domain-containing protein [Caballeronia sp. J97]|uniref:NAD(P)-binding domain-containing protein n=1 Tax=Caballeronia sp. J97 TaxID=2805429 RepID=UPI002AB2C1FF|nr:NAD(P)-binding domain-containing protein [Caballeronia sp. J97]
MNPQGVIQEQMMISVAYIGPSGDWATRVERLPELRRFNPCETGTASERVVHDRLLAEMEQALRCDIVFLRLAEVGNCDRFSFERDGYLSRLSPGTVLVDLDGDPRWWSEEAEFRLERTGVLLLSATAIFDLGSETNTVLVSGWQDAYRKALPVLEAIGPYAYCGPRLVHAYAVALMNQSMYLTGRLLNLESVAMGFRAGLSLTDLTEAINLSSGRSRISEVLLPDLFRDDRKKEQSLTSAMDDLNRVISLGMTLGVPMPLASHTRSLLAMGANMVGANADLNDMHTVIGSMAGISLEKPLAEFNPVARTEASDTDLSWTASAPVIGYVGLGAMGAALARQALSVARELHVYDVSQDRVNQLVRMGAVPAPDVLTLAQKCDLIILCVPTSGDVENILFGEQGMSGGLKAGTIVIDQTTGSPFKTQMMAERLREQGVELIDAPVTGGPRGAAEGTLVTLCGGQPEAYALVHPILERMGGKISYFGASGAGQAAKLVKNALGASNRIAVYEALALASKIGLRLDLLDRLIERSSGWTAAFRRVIGAIRTGKPTADVKLSWYVKDLVLVSQMAAALRVPMSIANLVRSRVEVAQSALDGDVNVDALAALFEIPLTYSEEKNEAI